MTAHRITTTSEAAIRADERAKLAELLEANGATLVPFCATPAALFKMVCFLIRLNAEPETGNGGET